MSPALETVNPSRWKRRRSFPSSYSATIIMSAVIHVAGVPPATKRHLLSGVSYSPATGRLTPSANSLAGKLPFVKGAIRARLGIAETRFVLTDGENNAA